MRKRKNRGNTLVEVMVSFFVLTMLLALFSHVFFLSGQIESRTVNAVKDREQLYEHYYLGQGLASETAGKGKVSFIRIGGTPGGEAGGFIVEEMEVRRHMDRSGEGEAVYDVALPE